MSRARQKSAKRSHGQQLGSGLLAAKSGRRFVRDHQTVWERNRVNTRRRCAGAFASARDPRLNTARHNERREEVGVAGQRRGTSRFDRRRWRGESPPALPAALRISPARGAQLWGPPLAPCHRSSPIREFSVWVQASGRCASAQSVGGNNNFWASPAQAQLAAFPSAGADRNTARQSCNTIRSARRAESCTRAPGIESTRP